jgi:hypothetical protein
MLRLYLSIFDSVEITIIIIEILCTLCIVRKNRVAQRGRRYSYIRIFIFSIMYGLLVYFLFRVDFYTIEGMFYYGSLWTMYYLTAIFPYGFYMHVTQGPYRHPWITLLFILLVMYLYKSDIANEFHMDIEWDDWDYEDDWEDLDYIGHLWRIWFLYGLVVMSMSAMYDIKFHEGYMTQFYYSKFSPYWLYGFLICGGLILYCGLACWCGYFYYSCYNVFDASYLLSYFLTF